MRILRIDATFLLPEGFKGSSLDALTELVRFLGDPEAGFAEEPRTAVFGDALGNFYHNTTLGLRFSAAKLGVYELIDDKPWHRVIDLKLPPRAYDDGAAMIK